MKHETRKWTLKHDKHQARRPATRPSSVQNIAMLLETTASQKSVRYLTVSTDFRYFPRRQVPAPSVPVTAFLGLSADRVPAGASENSPPLPAVGKRCTQNPISRSPGRGERSCSSGIRLVPFRCRLSSPAGLVFFWARHVSPALKRWAILHRPWRDEGPRQPRRPSPRARPSMGSSPEEPQQKRAICWSIRCVPHRPRWRLHRHSGYVSTLLDRRTCRRIDRAVHHPL